MISHEHQAVFVHIPKCGGTSVEGLFLDDLGLSVRQRAPLLLRGRDEDEKAPPRLAHLIAPDYVDGHYMSQRQWDVYTTFSVVRDPYKRAESTYFFLAYEKFMSFETYCTTFLAEATSDPSHLIHWFVRPQVDFLGVGTPYEVKEIARLENLDLELPPVLESCGIHIDRVPRLNVTAGRESYETFKAMYRAVARFGAPRTVPRRHDHAWTAAAREGVARVYAADFDHLGYSTDVV